MLKLFDKNVVIYDVETYKNYFVLFAYYNKKYTRFDLKNIGKFKRLISNKILVGYNNHSFDDVIINFIIDSNTKNDKQVYSFAQDIINQMKQNNNDKKSMSYKQISNYKYKNNIVKSITFDTIDLFSLSFKTSTEQGMQSRISLKDLAIRLKHNKIQDLPYDIHTSLTMLQKNNVDTYCINDVEITKKVYESQINEIKIRKYLIDKFEISNYKYKSMLSMSRPNISEKIIQYLYLSKTKHNYNNIMSSRKFINNKTTKINLKECIKSDVYFTMPNLLKLKQLITTTNLKFNDGKVDKEDFNKLQSTIKIGKKEYNFALGGLHSKDDGRIYTSTDEYIYIDADVTSFYPNLQIEHNIYPNHLGDIFLRLLKDLKDERINFKNNNMQFESEALKIIINALYGKLQNKYSFLYDPQAAFSVTITGQLLLLKLIETLELNKIEVISANTDGLCVKIHKNQSKLFQSICEKWQKQFKLELAYNIYKTYARLNVNNYLSIQQNNKIKNKGDFLYDSLNKKNDTPIIKKAIENYFLTGQSVSDYILKCKNIYEFLYSFKASKTFNVYQDKTPLQRTNRWYIIKNEETIKIQNKLDTCKKSEIDNIYNPYKLYKIKNTSKKTSINIPDATFACIINNIADETHIPKDLDINHYIHKAENIIFKLENYTHAKQLLDQGIPTIPEELKKYPSKSKLSEIKSNWDYAKSAGLGIYTGEKAKIICIDVDDTSKASHIKSMLIPTLTIYHANKEIDISECYNLKHNAKFIYFYENSEITTLSKYQKSSVNEKFGIDILYGNAAAQCRGYHTSYEKYIMHGKIAHLPEKLEKWILEVLPKRAKKQKKEKLINDLLDTENKIQPYYYKLFKNLVHTQEFKSCDLYEKDADIANGYYASYKGYCPCSDEHTRNSNDTDYIISLHESGKIVMSCFHTSCYSSLYKFMSKINIMWVSLISEYKSNIKEDIPIHIYQNQNDKKLQILHAKEIKTIKEAMNNKSHKFKIVIAPTGSGKSYESIMKFIDCIKNKKHVMYVAANKNDMAQFTSELIRITNRQINELSTQEINADIASANNENNLENDENKAVGGIKINSNTLGIITHHTYITRKGVSLLYYPLLEEIKKNKYTVIIDECDTAAEKQSYSFQLTSQYLRRTHRGSEQKTYMKLDKCPKNCTRCTLLNSMYEEINEYNIHQLSNVYKINSNLIDDDQHQLSQEKVDKFKSDYHIIEFDNEYYIEYDKMHAIEELNMKIINIKQNTSALLDNTEKQYKIKDKELLDIKEAITDIVNCSYNPTVYMYYPTKKINENENEQISYKNLQTLEKSDMKNIKFPHFTCYSLMYSLKDMSAFRFLYHTASEVIFLTATLTDTNKDFIKASFCNDIQEFIVPKQSPKIDNLLLICTNKQIQHVKQCEVTYDKIGNLNKKILTFTPTKREATKTFKKIASTNYNIALFDQNTYNQYKDIEKEPPITTLTYSRSTLGRGINLYNYYYCFVDTRIYKPSFAYEVNEGNLDTIKQKRQDDRVAITLQNAGRILRISPNHIEGNKYNKAIVLQYVEKQEMESFKKAFQPLIKNEVECVYYDDIDLIIPTLLHYQSTGKFKEMTCDDKKDVLIKKFINSGKSSLSKKQRDFLGEKLMHKLQQDKLFDELKYKVQKYKNYETFSKRLALHKKLEDGKLRYDQVLNLKYLFEGEN